ncbi:hypothetical protein Enr13x_36750 [Stieleria neptunia]|uniref:Uncharacterized protein n=1 Tax=Stieleria neptunia TaxID=2527979 RepID=A0A518HSJ1_9BACT|nr:hypothetical protein [Stieleria neptunia]QDV43815.1 hypothetical protein Enr13x_36750 [Stieleria neptunia]
MKKKFVKNEAISFKIEPDLKAAFLERVPDGGKRSDKLRQFVTGIVNGTSPEINSQSQQMDGSEFNDRLDRIERAIQGLATALENIAENQEKLGEEQESFARQLASQQEHFQYHIFAFFNVILQNHHVLFPDKSTSPSVNDIGQILFAAFEQAQKDIEK